MPGRGDSAGLVSRIELDELIELYNRFKHADDPLHPEVVEAGREFGRRLEAIYQDTVADHPEFGRLSLEQFRACVLKQYWRRIIKSDREDFPSV